MDGFLFGTYRFVALLLFLVLSAVLLYHRLFRRWLKFSLGYLAVYALGGYLFFGKLLLPLSETSITGMPYLLFFFGSIACVGICVIRQLTIGQSVGMLACYLVVLLTFQLLAGVDIGLPRQGAVAGFLTSLPYVLFFAGTPIVLGVCLVRGLSVKETAGVLMMFSFALGLLVMATSSYFGRPFGFAPELSLHTRAWIEVGSVLIAILGFALVAGGALLNSLSLRETFGAVVTFLVGAALLISLVHLSIGYEVLGRAIGAE